MPARSARAWWWACSAGQFRNTWPSRRPAMNVSSVDSAGALQVAIIDAMLWLSPAARSLRYSAFWVSSKGWVPRRGRYAHADAARGAGGSGGGAGEHRRLRGGHADLVSI